MIRRATQGDAFFILDLTKRFSKKYYDGPLDLNRAASSINRIIKDGTCFVSNNGFIGGVLVDSLFHDETALVELGWYAEDSSGARLLDEFIQAGWDAGATEIRMTTLNNSPGVAHRLLYNRGFYAAETSYRLRPKE